MKNQQKEKEGRKKGKGPPGCYHRYRWLLWHHQLQTINTHDYQSTHWILSQHTLHNHRVYVAQRGERRILRYGVPDGWKTSLKPSASAAREQTLTKKERKK